MVQEKMKKRITLQYLIKNDLPIWVRNNSGDLEQEIEPGDICLQVSNVHKMPPVVIPPGDDPVCITDQVDPDALKGFRDLFVAVQKGALELLDPEEADKYYEENEDRRKIVADKIDKYINNIPDDKRWVKEVTDSEVKLQPKVTELCQRAKHEAIDEREMLEKLFGLKKLLKDADYAYLCSHGKYSGVKHWAQDQLKEEQAKAIKELG